MPRPSRIPPDVLQIALTGLEQRRATIQQQIDEIRRMLNGGTRLNAGAVANNQPRSRAQTKRALSPEARKRIADAQRKRWAAARKKKK